MAAEEKARAVYENLIHLTDDVSVIQPLLFLRQREIVHFNRFRELYDYYVKNSMLIVKEFVNTSCVYRLYFMLQ